MSNRSVAGRGKITLNVRNEAYPNQNTHGCLCNADSFSLFIFSTNIKFSPFLIQQKELLQPSKPKLPTRNLLLIRANVQKTPTLRPRSPTPAVFMSKHLKERRAAPKHSSTWSRRSLAYLHCRSQMRNRTATVGELIHHLRRWKAVMAVLGTPALRGNLTPAPDLILQCTLLIRRARGIRMTRPALRSRTRPLPNLLSDPPELQTRRRLNQNRRPPLSQWWSKMSLKAAATSGGRLISLTVWRRVSRQRHSRCQVIFPQSSKWMLRTF